MSAGQIVWTEAMCVGVTEIDVQHQKLIALINSVEQAMKLGHSRDCMGDWLRALAKYALFHFQAEEIYMHRIGYPHLEDQKGEHAGFSQKVIEFNDRYINHDALLTVEMMQYLKNWTMQHILNSDGKIGRFVNRDKEEPDATAEPEL